MHDGQHTFFNTTHSTVTRILNQPCFLQCFFKEYYLSVELLAATSAVMHNPGIDFSLTNSQRQNFRIVQFEQHDRILVHVYALSLLLEYFRVIFRQGLQLAAVILYT